MMYVLLRVLHVREFNVITHHTDTSVHLYYSRVQLRNRATRHLRHHRSNLSLLFCNLLHDDICQGPSTENSNVRDSKKNNKELKACL